MWLNSADPLFQVPWSLHAPSVITGAIASGPLGVMGPQTTDGALVMAQVDVYNSRAAPAAFEVSVSVLDAEGKEVAAGSVSSNLSAGGWARRAFFFFARRRRSAPQKQSPP